MTVLLLMKTLLLIVMQFTFSNNYNAKSIDLFYCCLLLVMLIEAANFFVAKLYKWI